MGGGCVAAAAAPAAPPSKALRAAMWRHLMDRCVQDNARRTRHGWKSSKFFLFPPPQSSELSKVFSTSWFLRAQCSKEEVGSERDGAGWMTSAGVFGLLRQREEGGAGGGHPSFHMLKRQTTRRREERTTKRRRGRLPVGAVSK